MFRHGTQRFEDRNTAMYSFAESKNRDTQLIIPKFKRKSIHIMDITDRLSIMKLLQRATFHIEELDCAHEARPLQKQLEGQPGVDHLDFDLINHRLHVTFDTAVTSENSILERIHTTGMQAQLRQGGQTGGSPAETPRNRPLALTSIAGILLVGGYLAHAQQAGSITAPLAMGMSLAESSVPILSRCLYAVAIGLGMWNVVPKAWLALRQRRADMNLLMSIAVVGAILLGEWLEAAVVTFLFTVALMLEHWSTGRARRAIATLIGATPPTARCVDPQGTVQECNVDEVAIDTHVIVRPGEQIPLDGKVLEGRSSVNQAPITGESQPVAKAPGNDVFAGTINVEGMLQIRVTRQAVDSKLARIIQMIESAHARRAPTEQWVETFARFYTPAIMAAAGAIAVLPPLLMGELWSYWIYNALVLLVIACPCALVISTPVSIVSALTAAARHGVLVKGGRFLEAAADLRAVAIDKTGTLTRGELSVQEVVPCNGHTRSELLKRAASMEQHSNHPIAQAIRKCAQHEGISSERVQNYRILSGQGAEAEIGGKTYWIGNYRLSRSRAADTQGIGEQARRLQATGHSVVTMGNSQHVCGLISLADAVRDDAPDAVHALRRLGVGPVVMVTGDNEPAARAVAQAVDVDDHAAELLPEDKVSTVESLRNEHGHVAMIGDGVNDAPALAASTLGIAMGAIGTDTAIETADIALMSDELTKVPWLIRHARRTRSVIRQNLSLALGLKLLFVGLTLTGTASLWMAIAADMGASLLVIFNGLRLLRA